MAAAYVQRKHQYPGDTATFDTDVQAGALIVVALTYSVSEDPTAPTDTLSNTYTKAVERFNSGGTRTVIWYTYDSPAGACQVSWSGAPVDIGGTIYEYSGIITASDPLRTTATSTSEADTVLPASQSFTPTIGDLIFVAFGDETGCVGTITAVTGYDQREVDPSHVEAQEDRVAASGSAQLARFNVSAPGIGNSNWAMAVAVFIPISDRRWILIKP